MITMKSDIGSHIIDTCREALALAVRCAESVTFTFNGTDVVVEPTETDVAAIEARWRKAMDEAHERHITSPEYKAAEAKREADLKKAMAAPMKVSVTTEAEMRAAEVPWPYTMAQLEEYIRSLTERPHDYGTCVHAMSMAAAAAFYYVSRQLGVTGFQSSCADLDFLRRIRGMKGPFILLKAEDALYPQYDLPEKLADALREWQPWLAEQARAKLRDESLAHPSVVDHWKKLAGEP